MNRPKQLYLLSLEMESADGKTATARVIYVTEEWIKKNGTEEQKRRLTKEGVPTDNTSP